MTLRKKMAHGALWSLVEKAGNQGLSFVIFMFVARLIGPKEYGLANICFVVFALANLLILGLVDGIISLQIKDTRRLSTMFWCVVGVGITLTAACMGGAGVVADLMGEPRLKLLLQCFSPVFLCLAASVIPNKLVYAALDFKVFALRTLIASSVSGVVGLILAFKGLGAFAIVGQQLVLYLVINFVVWHYVDWRPSFVFDRSLLKHSLLPGFKMMGADFITFTEDQIPRLFVGGILGSVVLGYYAFVARIRFALQDILIYPVLNVLCPSLATINHDREEQKLILGQVISLMGFFIFPALALSVYLAPVYVPLFLGTAWLSAVPVLQIFICGSAAVPVLIVMRESLRAHNRLGSYMRVQIPMVTCGLIITFILLPHGLKAMVSGSVFWVFCSVPLYAYFFERWLGISLWHPILRLAKPLAAVAVMLAAMYGFTQIAIYPDNAWVRLVSSLVLGGGIYLMVSFVFQRREMTRMLGLAAKIMASRQKSQSGI